MSKKIFLILVFLVLLHYAWAECGNASCEAGESYANCPSDCPAPQTLELTVDSPSQNQAFLRGDNVTVKIEAVSDGKKTLDLDLATAYGFFGTIYLYDDGKHNDEKWKDGIYANSFAVKPSQAAGIFSIFVSTRQNKAYMLKKITIEIKPELTTSLETDKEAYYLGDEIFFAGSLKRHEEQLQQKFFLIVSDAQKKEKKIEVETDETGKFSAILHTSLIDAPGTWSARFSTNDDFNNAGTAEKNFEVKNPENKSFLSIKLVEEPDLFYKRGSDLLLLARIFDDLEKEIFDANLEVETPLGEKIAFEKSDLNVFFVSTRIPVSMPSGKQSFYIRAKSLAKEGLKSGDLNVTINIKEIGMRIDLLSPNVSQVKVGDTVLFSARVYYENGEPLSLRVIPAKINNETIGLFYEGTGIYSANYIVKPTDSAINFAIDFDDGFQNKADFSTQISVQGVSIMHYLREYYLFILAACAILLIMLWIFKEKIKKHFELQYIKKQEKAIEEMLEKTDKKYIEGNISREEFNRISARSNAELLKIRTKIKEAGGTKNAKK